MKDRPHPGRLAERRADLVDRPPQRRFVVPFEGDHQQVGRAELLGEGAEGGDRRRPGVDQVEIRGAGLEAQRGEAEGEKTRERRGGENPARMVDRQLGDAAEGGRRRGEAPLTAGFPGRRRDQGRGGRRGEGWS